MNAAARNAKRRQERAAMLNEWVFVAFLSIAGAVCAGVVGGILWASIVLAFL